MINNLRKILPLLLFIIPVSNSRSQQIQITRIRPANITLRGISMPDSSHTMTVGDSATILINLGSSSYTYGDLTQFERTWSELPPPVPRNHTFYGVSYFDSLRAIVIGDAGLILRTNDQGATWAQISKGLTNATLRGIWQISDGTFEIIGDGGVMLRSVDSGLSWTKINSGTTATLFAITFGTNQIGLAVGEKGVALKTTDAGLTWQTLSGFIDPQIHFYAVAMSGPDSAIVVGDSDRIHYTNDGINWHRAVNYYSDPFTTGFSTTPNGIKTGALRSVIYTHAGTGSDSTHPIAYAAGDDDATHRLFARINVRYDESVFHLRPRDTTWILQGVTRIGDADGTSDPAASRLQCITANRNGTQVIFQFAGSNGELGETRDFFQSFYGPRNPIRRGGLDALSVSIDSLGAGFAASVGGTINRTLDNGTNWVTVFQDTKRLISGVHTFDSNTAIIAGWDGYIYRTTNGGRHWTTEPNSIVQYKLHSFAFATHDVGICVGDQGTILRTSDAGITWKDVGDHLNGSFLNRVAFSSATIGVLVGQNGTIRRSTDGGLTWPASEKPGTPFDFSNANLKYIDAFPDGAYIIGADSGVIRSTDQGVNWSYIAVPPCAIGSSFYNSQIGIVGEYNTSTAIVPDTMVLKYTLDGGKNWSNSFKVGIVNTGRLTTHWLDSHTFLLYGSEGFIVKVDLSGPNVVTHVISSSESALRVYPNPSNGPSVTIDYTTPKEGPVSIELTDELGRPISVLYTRVETPGEHSRTVQLPPNLQGSYIVSLKANGQHQALKVVKF